MSEDSVSQAEEEAFFQALLDESSLGSPAARYIRSLSDPVELAAARMRFETNAYVAARERGDHPDSAPMEQAAIDYRDAVRRARGIDPDEQSEGPGDD